MSSKRPPATEVVQGFGSVPAELLSEAEANQRRIDELRDLRRVQSAAAYHDLPHRFVLECIKWDEVAKDGEDARPTKYQLKNLVRLAKKKKLAVRGPHGLGKTAQNAWVVLWFALTRDAAEEDWKAITTASAWRQLTHFLWPEIKKWARYLDWNRLGREPFSKDELLQMKLRLEYGEAFAVACEDPATIEGAHADQMLYIYDEAKTIPAATFDASEGAFSGAGKDTTMEAYALASSTPGEPNGRFHEIHSRKAGLQDWLAVRVSLAEAMEAGRVSEDWRRERARQWGEGSQVYINRVLGEFAPSEEDGVCPLDWIEKANDRWRKLHDAGFPEMGLMTCAAADIARSGSNKTIIALRYGHVIKELRRLSRAQTEDLMQTAGILKAVVTAEEDHRPVIVDVIGLGAGVLDRLREMGQQATGFNASEKCDMLDASGELGFVNKRSAAWWNLRDMLAPDSGHDLALPPDDGLVGDLTAPKWKITSGGRIQVESKDDIAKRIGRSTDEGDAVVMAFFTDMGPGLSAPILLGGQSRWHAAGQRIV